MFPGQNYGPRVYQGSHMQNNILRPPGNLNTDLFDDSSKKRKSVVMDQPRPKSESRHEYSSPFGSSIPNGTIWGGQIQNQVYEQNLQQTKVSGPTNFVHQFDKNQFQYQNSYQGPSVTNNMNFLPNSTQNIGNVPSPPPPPPQSSAYGGSFGSVNIQNVEGVARSIWQSQACNLVGSIQNYQSLNNEGVNNVANLSYSFPQNGAQFGASGSFGVSAGDISENRGPENLVGSVRAVSKTEESDLENLNLMPGVSPVSRITPKSMESNFQKDSISGSLSLEEKEKLYDDKLASTAAEKLWEGSLQLSSTVTVPSVAFFKSGEKLLNANWYKSVEVKGKVKLDAFEKYIEGLPHSHNKGLMVISICCKEGSSETGLKGMKEVARGYTRTNRVGFAYLSREIHLYICPRNNSIITILAKYGFFKGMTAIEENQDSMIGCVIWRKDRTPSSNSVAKKTENKSKAPSKFSDSDSDLEDSPLTQLVQEIVAPLSATFTSTVQGDGKNGGKCNKNSPMKTQNDNSLCTPISILSSHQVAQGALEIINNQEIKILETEPAKENFTFQNHTIPSPNIRKETKAFDEEDDDLPEFDFMAASKPSLSNTIKPAERERRMPDMVQKMDTPVQRGAPDKQANSLPIPNFTNLEKRENPQNHILTNLVNNPKKNRFDDDDMPEWSPPEHQNLPSAGTIPPQNINPSNFQVSNFQNGPPISPQGQPPLGHFHEPEHQNRRSVGTIRPQNINPSNFRVSNFQNGPPISPQGQPPVGHFHKPDHQNRPSIGTIRPQNINPSNFQVSNFQNGPPISPQGHPPVGHSLTPQHQNRPSAGTIRPQNTNPSNFPVSNFHSGPPISPQGPPVGHFHKPQPRPLERGSSFENGFRSNSILGSPPIFINKDKQG